MVKLGAAVTALVLPTALAGVVYDSTAPKLGAVASEVNTCSRIGTDVLKKGGNAADAAVATTFCVGTIGMYHSGIAGGGFMLIRSPEGKYEFVDFRETAPAAAFEDMYKNNTEASLTGGLASGVPGELRGLEHLHKKYGKLSWKDLVMPAVHLARNGFPVTRDLVRYFVSATSSNNFLANDPQFAQDFAPNGTVLGLGDTLTRKRYADTLETIACEGPGAFYKGPIAEATIKALQAKNGTMTLKDLKDYKVALRKPVSINYKGYKLTACSAPSGGSVALAALNIFGGYKTNQDKDLNLTTHYLDESMRFAYGMRANLGDPSFAKNISTYEKNMVKPQTGEEVRSRISDLRTFDVDYYDPAGLESLETPGTSHIVAADKDGLAITMTTTINLLFGSKVVVPETGVIMNNEMNDFSIPGSSNAFGYIPSPVNYVKPGKRPLSSISPIIADDRHGKFYLAVGAAGGSRIITATIQNTWYVLDRGFTTAKALYQPRLHDQLVPNTAVVEYSGLNIVGYDNGTADYLRTLGHNVTFTAPGSSTAQALRRLSNGTFEAAGEPRQYDSGGFAV